jgi:hypothetical protein
MTPAEELRKAAERIREVAGNAPAGPWSLVRNRVVGSPDRDPFVIHEGYDTQLVAAHIALWDPAVAEAVALVLENEAMYHYAARPQITRLARAINAKGGHS